MNSRHLNNDQIGNVTWYQTLDTIGKAWLEVISQHLDLPKTAKILDAGCGTGFLTLLLAGEGYTVTALDTSAPALKLLQDHARELGISDKVICCHCDTTETPLEAGSFDAVVSRHASALFTEPRSVYQEWFRLLKKGGMVLNFDANWLSPLWDEDRARAFMEDEQKLRETVADYTDVYHDRFAIFKLSQYPLSYQDRPNWDLETCRDIGYAQVESYPMTAKGMLPPVLAQRFRSIPAFLVKAYR